MSEFNDTYHKAGVLMQSALKKYEKGDIEGGNKDRQMANDMYDLAEKEVDSEQGMTMLYGENRNFGIIYKVFESNAPKLFKEKNGKVKLGKILNLIKENKVLKSEFDIYKSLVYPDSVCDSETYVNEAVSVIHPLKKEDVVRNNEELIRTFRKLGLDEMVEISDDDMKLMESVEFVTLNRKNLNNANEFAKAKKCLSEHIDKNCKYTEVNSNSVDEVLREGIDSVNEKYVSDLTDEEKMLVEKLNGITSKEAYFDIAKNDTIKILNERLNECDEENYTDLEKIVENVAMKTYDEDRFISDAAEFREIKDTLTESEKTDTDSVESLSIELARNCIGESTRNRDWIISELSYITDDETDASKIVEDIERMADKYKPENMGGIIKTNLKAGKYKGWWKNM